MFCNPGNHLIKVGFFMTFLINYNLCSCYFCVFSHKTKKVHHASATQPRK
jgi:hypothetical protein